MAPSKHKPPLASQIWGLGGGAILIFDTKQESTGHRCGALRRPKSSDPRPSSLANPTSRYPCMGICTQGRACCWPWASLGPCSKRQRKRTAPRRAAAATLPPLETFRMHTSFVTRRASGNSGFAGRLPSCMRVLHTPAANGHMQKHATGAQHGNARSKVQRPENKLTIGSLARHRGRLV